MGIVRDRLLFVKMAIFFKLACRDADTQTYILKYGNADTHVEARTKTV